MLKIVSAGSQRAPYAVLASELRMSPSEVHASVKRAEASQLLHGKELQHRPNFPALEAFFIHGLRYVFPAERGGMTRGIPAPYAAEPLRSLIAPNRD